jgi:outer membrane receptor protein involved in Fe transport
MKPFILCIFLLASFAPASAQVSRVAGALAGTITDPTGAVVPDSTITATNVDTGQQRSVSSDTSGFFRFSELGVGTYQLRVQHPGFAEYTGPDLTVLVGQTVHLEIRMHPANTSAELTVAETTPVLDTSVTTLVTNVDTERIEELPVQSRNYLNFVLLSPGVAPSANTRASAPGAPVANDSGFSFGGLRGASNSVCIDGLDNNDEYSGASRTELSLEIVREFQVVNNGLSAEFGGASGGSINVVTKNGANTIHGDAFLFLQNGVLNARGPIRSDESPSDLSRYRAGFAIGGPIRKGKTFYYTAFEQEHSRATEFNDTAARKLNLSLVDGTLFPVTRAETEASTKLTHTLSPRNSLMLRYAFTNNREVADAFNHSALFDYSARGSSFVKDHAGVGSLMSVLSANFLNDLRFQFAGRQVTSRTTDQSGPGIEIAGIVIFGRPYAGNGSRQENHYEIADALSIARGHHLLKTGATWNRVALDALTQDGLGGQYTFGSTAEFLAGTPREYRQAFGDPHANFAVTAFGAFLQDTWSVRSGLTLTLGGRYDFERLPAQFSQDGNNFSPRIGVAYSLRTGWVLRAGYGIFFDRFLLAPLSRDLQPTLEKILFDAAAQSLWLSPAKTIVPPVALVQPSIYRAAPKLPAPYSQQVDLGIEHQLAHDMSASATYMFVRGVKLPRTENVNLAPPLTLTLQNAAALGFADPAPQQLGREVFGPGRLDPLYNAIYQTQNRSASTYHGLSVALNRKLTNEIAFSGSYTFSKTLDDASSFGEQPQDPYALRSERACSANDQRHRFVFSGLFDLPIGDEDDRKPGQRDNFLTRAFRNIELAPIFSAGSGRPLNPLVGFDALHSLAYPPSTRPLPNARNSFRTPSQVDLDFRLVKFFPVKPHGRLDLVGEVFNALNHPNIGALNQVFGPAATPASTFLQPTQTGRAREFQFSIDFEF